MNEIQTTNSLSTLYDYMIMYRKYLMSCTNVECDLDTKKLSDDISHTLRLITNRISNETSGSNSNRYELFRCYDIENLYQIDDELYYKNLKSSHYKYMLNVSDIDDESFEFFIVRISDGKFTEVEFIFYFTPLIDMIYKYADKPFDEAIIKFFNMFHIKSFIDFRNFLDNEYNIKIK